MVGETQPPCNMVEWSWWDSSL